jgi:hypothetical protein
MKIPLNANSYSVQTMIANQSDAEICTVKLRGVSLVPFMAKFEFFQHDRFALPPS